ncbi:site-specific DNA-methyltransferase [Haemophilus influenzae]|uniref:site-specific DNA-methyltransferase n=1 Tax=Haemophilus influenzae TaxID=727 RepID=UPI0010A2F703|nr:site-specific DNA-methyltransferase [Haemophilus influenzae]MCK8895165.1 site-specific DNA-methyltransferase [Haemophilus influenzae]
MIEITKETLFSSNTQAENEQLIILKHHFPNCFDKQGAFLPEKMAKALQSNGIKTEKESYSLNWLGKSYAKILKDRQPETLLAEDIEHNQKPENQNSENILIQGDNLEVLKHLKHAYKNQIKMIYIDPPYNTGSDGFVYQDDRKFTPQQLVELGMDLEEAERVLEFTAKKSNSHSAWLTFMYPRLYIARELLRDDGVIFISIDDNEQAQLKLLCDEVFGEENFVGQLPWRKRTAKSDVPFGVSQDYEWVLVYAKSADFIASTLGKERRYYETDDFPNRPWRTHDLTKQTTASERPNSFFTMIDPKTGKEYPANPNATWRVTKDTFQNYYDKDKIIFPDDYDFLSISRPVMRYFKDDDMAKAGEDFGRVAVSSRLPESVGTLADAVAEHLDILNRTLTENMGMTKEGTKEITDLFGHKVFTFPKPSQLIKFFVSISSKPSDLILDFFAGSGTTAHAVMQLNAEDNGNRKFICVQLPEPTNEKSEAYKAGYKTIFDITKARIEKSAVKIRQDFKETTADLGFKIFKTEPHFQTALNTDFDPQIDFLPKTDLNDKQLHTLLTTWRAFDGCRLPEKVQSIDLVGYTAYYCRQHLYLLASGFTSESVKALIERLDHDKDFVPERIVLFGENIDSAMQKELAQAVKTYANKKGLNNLSVLARY